LCELLLGRYGQVTTVENGQMALDLLNHQFFDVIVTDVDMPVLNGISLLRKAVKENSNLRAHFILCTANFTEDVMLASHEYGIPVLEKPASIHSMRAAIEKILSTAL
jgi:two-component system chemotaxis response regulator CheY